MEERKEDMVWATTRSKVKGKGERRSRAPRRSDGARQWSRAPEKRNFSGPSPPPRAVKMRYFRCQNETKTLGVDVGKSEARPPRLGTELIAYSRLGDL